MAAYFFSSPVDIDIKLEGEEIRKQVESKADKDRPISCPVYYDGESVSGQVRLCPSSLSAFWTAAECEHRSLFVFERASEQHMTGSKSSL